MSGMELLIKEAEGLPPRFLNEVIDFVGYLKEKRLLPHEADSSNSESFDALHIDGDCSLWADNPTFNETTLAAIADSRAIMNRGRLGFAL
jgi:hypothetical protein